MISTLLRIQQGIITALLALMVIAADAQVDRFRGISSWPPGITSDSLMATGLPLVLITTVDGEEPTCDYVTAPEGCLGESIANASKVPGRAVVVVRGDTLFDSGEYVKGESGMTIRIRGNSSAWSIKHPFKIKLQQKGDMLHRGDPRFDDRDWVLLYEAEYSLYNLLARTVCKMARMEWVPEGEYVNVVVNGDFRGLYFLSESVDRNPQCRIDVDKQSGYIVELDPYWWNEDVWFGTMLTQDSPYIRYTFKYPDSDEVTDEQIAYISGEISAVEASLMDSTYTDHIDVESFVTWVLVHDILGTWDEAGSNTFLMKHDSTPESKVRMGPPWDFDTILRMEGEWSRLHYSMLLPWTWHDDRDGAFTRRYFKRLEDVRGWLFDAVISWAEGLARSKLAEALDKSRAWDSPRWDIPFESVEGNVATITNWFSARKLWVRETVGISEVNAGNTANRRPSATYGLSGRKENCQGKGIYIRDGKKFIVRQ